VKHYPHHIGDFDKATRHLTRIERSVYRDLIDLYYDTEQRLTLDQTALCRRIIARSNEESTAVQQVLNEFFTETPTGWYHDRCEHEIAAYHANSSQKAMAGKASAEAKRLKKLQALNGASTAVEQPLKTVETETQRNSTNQSTNQPINHQPNRESAEAAPPSKPEKPKREQTTLTAYLDACKAAKSKPIPDGHSVRTWATDAGLAPEMLQIAWLQFRERYTESEKGKGKRYKDWPGHFATAVKANWFKLWFAGDNGMQWTSVGMTHKAVLDARMAQKEVEHA
jgi:uncharacterized protein YdaU (DUF1376 family)